MITRGDGGEGRSPTFSSRDGRGGGAMCNYFLRFKNTDYSRREPGPARSIASQHIYSRSYNNHLKRKKKLPFGPHASTCYVDASGAMIPEKKVASYGVPQRGTVRGSFRSRYVCLGHVSRPRNRCDSENRTLPRIHAESDGGCTVDCGGTDGVSPTPAIVYLRLVG